MIPWDELPTPSWVLPAPGENDEPERLTNWDAVSLTLKIERADLEGSGTYPCYHCGDADETVVTYCCLRNACRNCDHRFHIALDCVLEDR